MKNKVKHHPNPTPEPMSHPGCCVISELKSRMARQFDSDLETAAIIYRNVPMVMTAIKAAQDARKCYG